jgi:hypothetical protein
MYCISDRALGLRPFTPTRGTAEAVADDVAIRPAVIVAIAIFFIVLTE